MNLPDAFALLVDKYDLEVGIGQLLVTSREDRHSGNEYGIYENNMSINVIEGQFLYALLCFLKPTKILELGCGSGLSSSHMLEALQRNDLGELVSVDLDPNGGHMIPEVLRPRWKFIQGDVRTLKLPKSDFLFEDADHSYEGTKKSLEDAIKRGVKAAAVHDCYLHYGVRRAFDEVFGERGTKFLLDGTATGIGVWIGE